MLRELCPAVDPFFTQDNKVAHTDISVNSSLRYLLELKKRCSTSQIPDVMPTWNQFLTLSKSSFIYPPPPSQIPKQSNQKVMISNPVSECISPCWTEYLGSLVETFRQEISPMFEYHLICILTFT